MKTSVLTTLGLFGALALGVAQTIPNPGFEANSFTNPPGYSSESGNGGILGWVASGNTGLNPASGSPFADNGAVPDGANVAFIQSGPNSSLSTVISNLTVGQTYKVNFRVNARSGNTPNLKVDIAGTNVINTTVASVGGSNPYQYFAFDFTAADTNQTMTLRNDAAGDNTVLLDNFSIAVRNSGWSYAAWNDDASSGVVGTNTYTHALLFGTSSNTKINGVTFTGIPGPNPSQGGLNSFYTSGLTAVFNNDSNNLTNGGSAVLAQDFVYGGPPPETITINGLIVGNSYVATIYSVGFDSSGARAATFSVGDDRLTVNQDQFGNHNGIRVSYYYTAVSKSLTLTYVPLSGSTFHTYGFANYLVSQPANCNPPPPPTFTVFLPKVGLPPDEEGQGWTRPPVWEHLPDATDDSITVPNGRPIYALIVSGFGSNKYLDQLMTYNFARHLMARGAYVHYAWWNNLLAPYMERPLHHPQSHPGGLDLASFESFLTAEDASNKAAPAEDYQLVADALLFLSAIRQNNPSAIIIVVGHSMGGGSVVHIGAKADVVIDILAPFDPTNNRNYPWMPPLTETVLRTYNWTRWRVTRDTFLGFQELDLQGFNCEPAGPWLKDYTEARANSSFFCKGLISYHDAPTLGFGPQIINLHHGWQNEALFPFDYTQNYTFGHSPPPGGSSSQAPIPTTPEFCGFLQRCSDPGGWPDTTDLSSPCCQTGEGVGWPKDGHGEIVGYRGPVITGGPVPLGVRVQTSPQCGNCPNEVWPARSQSSDGTWSNGDGAARVALLQALESLPEATPWPHSPVNPNLCLVSPGLINLFDVMNKPPVADAGGNQTVECDASHSAQVTLNGSNSTDPDGDQLEYNWTWSSGSASGAVATVRLPAGTNCVMLTVRDPSGHIDCRTVTVTVLDIVVGNVTSLNDSGAGSLRNALATQNVVGFAPSLDGGTITLTSGQISLINSVTIDASSLPHGLTISGNNSNRIFEVSGGAAVTLNSLFLTNGYAGSGGSGGAILVDNGGTLTLTSCTVSGNSAAGTGGAIGNYGLVNITKSTVSSNTASGAGAIENDNGSLTINASTLSSNSVTGNGGAIDNDAGAVLFINNSTFSANSAVGGGGAIENFQAAATLNNCTLSGNSAGGAGGINNYGMLALTNTIVAGNTAPMFPDINLDVSGSFAGADNVTNGNPVLAALGNYGGPTQTMPPLPGSPALDGGSDSVTNFLRTDQRGFPRLVGAHVDIGAVEYLASPTVLTSADSGSGSLRDAVSFSINGTTITFTNTISGQTILLSSGQLTISGSLAIDASALPGGVAISGSNSSRIFEVNSGAVVTLNALALINGYAGSGGSGGAILVDAGGTLTMVNSSVLSNSAAYGGGLVNYGTLTLSNSVVVSNVATNNSGGVENDGGTLTISDSLISSNSASFGGGLGSFFSNAVTVITNTTVLGNRAVNDGGGVYNVSGSLAVNSSTLFSNTASFGGGLLNNGTLTLSNSAVWGNVATNNSGGVDNDSGTLTISGSLISSNSASFGGGIRNGSGSALLLNNSTLSENSATNNGGGIVNNSSALTLNNSTLYGNSAGFGGALYNVNTGTVTLVNSTLFGNSARSDASSGGGIFQDASGGPCALTNTIVAGNIAAGVANNISGSFSGANNLTSGDPLLAPLDNYGGPTATMRPQPGSPAIDAGLDSVTNLLATDQRGYPRLYGAHVDIGAVEARLAIVSNLNDSGAGSLRDAFTAGPDGIGFATNLAGGMIMLTNGQISIAGDVTVDVSTLPGSLSISGNNSSRIFEVIAGANLTLNGLRLVNGYAGSGDAGGAILVDPGGVLSLNKSTISGNSTSEVGGGIASAGLVIITNSTLSGNAAAFAGAIENYGTLTVAASTISGNVATNNGGAIDNDFGAALLLNNSTLSGNSAGFGGGGIENYQATATLNNCTLSGNSAGGAGGINNLGTLVLTNTIVAGNTAPFQPDLNLDSSGSFTGAYNLTNGNPLLAPLGHYGGPTQTMPPLLGSPAIDAGLDSVTSFLATDQRGFPRRSGTHVDIGAAEAQWAFEGNPPFLTAPVPNSDGTFSFNFATASFADFTVLTSTNVALPSGQWSILGAAAQSAPNQYQFTDFGATNYPQRFYQLVSP